MMRKTIYSLFVVLIIVAFTGSSMAGSRRLKPDRDTKGCVEVEVAVSHDMASPGQEVTAKAWVKNCSEDMPDKVILIFSLAYEGDGVDLRYDGMELMLGRTYLKLRPGEARSAGISFEVPYKLRPGIYSLSVDANSYHGGHAEDSAFLTVK